jgi:transposase-like protein
MSSTNVSPASGRRPAEPWLEARYHERDGTLEEIAEEVGCSPHTVAYWLRYHDIPLRAGIREPSRRAMASHPLLTDEDWLREQYVERGRTLSDIGDELGCHPQSVLGWLRRHGIETGSRRS